ncbi:MAG: hypothetical protein IPK68_07010 [Bdellovibrionales bacterium]|nr:hypothetical protein [Bdellovibrionales bacterium]
MLKCFSLAGPLSLVCPVASEKLSRHCLQQNLLSRRPSGFLRKDPDFGFSLRSFESFFTLIEWLAYKPSVNLLYQRHRELAEANLRGSGSSSAWCSAHNGSAAAGRMFEDPEFLRFGSARVPWSLEQQSGGPD